MKYVPLQRSRDDGSIVQVEKTMSSVPGLLRVYIMEKIEELGEKVSIVCLKRALIQN